MAEILWHRRETRRQTEKTNICLNGGKAPVYSPTDFMRVLGIPLLAPDLAMKSGQFSCEGAKAEGPQFDPHSHDHQDCLVEVEDGGDSGGGKVGEVVGGVPAAWGAGGLGV